MNWRVTIEAPRMSGWRNSQLPGLVRSVVMGVAGHVSLDARHGGVHQRRRRLAVDLTGVWQTWKANIPHLISGGRGGSITLTASSAGIKGVSHLGHYVAAKHGVVGLMKTPCRSTQG